MVHCINDDASHFIKERVTQSQLPAEERSAPEYSPQDISSAFVGGHYAIGDEKGNATRVFSHNPDGPVDILVPTIFFPRQAAHVVDQREKQVRFIRRGLALNSRQSSLQSHTGINVRFGQRSAPSVGVLIILSEHQVPYFREATAVAVGPTFSSVTAKLFAKVIMNLAARPTGARITNGTPKVIFVTEAQYPAGRHA